MSRTTGFSRYVCDRCGTTVHAPDGGQEVQAWQEVKRVTASGTGITRLLCPACAKAYYDLAQGQDTGFTAFMEAGRKREEQ
ncbi:hypothetical protein [Collinsella vaginalis]|uniref:hypothetical protein n=1 Tax=Collinsella vaginalis TaxID=1870987 RepID=UPI000A26975A|nr:hypothetical protein [Collinsella vaginalis]